MNKVQGYKVYLIPGILAILFSCTFSENKKGEALHQKSQDVLVNAEGKKGMIMLTDRPPNLETPLEYFKLDYTPNEVFFVRWHLPVLPPPIDEDTFKLRIHGHVKKQISFTLQDLKTKFRADTLVALAACAGNARSFMDPRVPGGQWKNGAMGNAKWTGVILKDILEEAVVDSGAYDVSFNGMDNSAFPTVADFVKSLKLNHAMDGEVMIAYEMNGAPLPWLNGYPLKLIVPGWYATYWVGMLNEITVHADTFGGYWMKKAYLIPKGSDNANETPDSLAKELEPIHQLDVRSIFVSPEPGQVFNPGSAFEIQGLAFDHGAGISKVEISTDNGVSWQLTTLDQSIGKYAWRRWRYTWKPLEKGTYYLKVKATNTEGETQPEKHWNRSGYMRNEIEVLELKVE